MGKIIYLLGFLVFTSACMLYPKKRGMSFFTSLMFSYETVLCFGAVLAGAMSLVKLPIDSQTMGFAFLVCAIVLYVVIALKKNSSHFFGRKQIWQEYLQALL